MAVHILICEDDPLQNQRVQQLVHSCSYPCEVKVDAFLTPSSLMGAIRQHKGPKIVILDITLSENQDGVALGKQINQIDPDALIIFMSQFLEKACEVYEADHCYFIYKQQIETRLPLALKRAFSKLEANLPDLVLHTLEGPVVLKPEEIIYLERIRRYTIVYTATQTFKVKELMEEMIEKVPVLFCRTHRSFTANLAHVQTFLGTDFRMKDQRLVPVSRSYAKQVKERFSEYLLHSWKGQS